MELEDVSPAAGDPKGQPAPGADAAAGDKGDKGKGKGKSERDTLLEKISALEKTNQQLAESERFWASRAQGGADPDGDPDGDGGQDVDPDGGDADLDDDTPEKLVDELSAKGLKALQKRGVVTKKDVEALIEKRATEIAKGVVEKTRRSMTHDAEIVSQFPELRDEKSDLFRETGKIYRELVGIDPKLKDSPATLLIAARQAKQGLAMAAGARRTTDDEREERRLERVRAQQGDNGRGRGSRSAVEDDDDALSPLQKSIAAALGVKEEDYLDEQTKLRRR